MVSGATNDSILNCNCYEYPDNPEFDERGLDYNLTLIDQHLIKARYHAQQHPIPYTEAVLAILGLKNTDLEIATIILLHAEVFPNWSTNALQQSLLEQERENLLRLDRCCVCGIIKGTYCEPCRSHKPRQNSPPGSNSGTSFSKSSAKPPTKRYQKKSTKNKQYRGPD